MKEIRKGDMVKVIRPDSWDNNLIGKVVNVFDDVKILPIEVKFSDKDGLKIPNKNKELKYFWYAKFQLEKINKNDQTSKG